MSILLLKKLTPLSYYVRVEIDEFVDIFELRLEIGRVLFQQPTGTNDTHVANVCLVRFN